MLGLLIISCLLWQAASSRHPDEPMYLVTVTSRSTGGSTETVCAHVFHQGGPLSFKLALEMGTKNTTLLEQIVTTDFHNCLQVQIPPVLSASVATIHASVKGENTSLSKRTKIQIIPSSSLTIIQTDKPVYKPGQTIKFRIVSIDSSFLPHSEVYETVELQDPNLNRIAQWLNQSISTGILDLSHSTTREAKQGMYTISAWTKKGRRTFQTFEILEYVLPKFEVTVHLPQVIYFQDKKATVKICGKYTYGKPVLGSVKAEVCRVPQMFSYALPLLCTHYAARTEKTGCATISINATDIMFYSRASHVHHRLNVECTMEEDETGLVLKGSGSTYVITEKISIQFRDTALTFKPGMNFNGTILMTGHRSVANKKIFLFGPEGGSWTLNADSEGVAHFSLDTSSWSNNVARFHAQCTGHSVPSMYGYSDECSADHTAFIFYSKSKSFLSINRVKEPLPCYQDGQVQAQYIIRGEELKGRNTLDFFHLVSCKGSIVQHGRHEITLNEGEVQRGELSFSLQHTEDLAPYAQLVLYTVLPNGEVVVDSYDYPIQLCFKNKVSLQFSSSVELPGEKALLEVTAQPGSLCSLRAIDQSVLLMKPDKELTTQKVYENLNVRKLSGYPVDDMDPPPCFPPALDGPVLPMGPGHPISSSGHDNNPDAYKVFQAVGVKALTNLDLKKPVICFYGYGYGLGYGYGHGYGYHDGAHYDFAVPAVGHQVLGAAGIGAAPAAPILPFSGGMAPLPPKETIRTFFPETWIWDLVSVGDAGTVTVQQTVPDTITTWATSAFCTSPAGFGLAPGINLTAFQPFFVSLTLPYSVIRGEVFPLKATVFNYLSKCIMVHVRLRESAEFTSQPWNGYQYKRCLCGEESGTFTWVITATSLGGVNISVSAEALSSEELCGNEVITVPERGQIDTVVRKLLVEPEGTTQTISHNALLCPQGGAVEKTIALELPEVFVEGSAKAFVSVLGDLMGRAMKNLDRLLAMPFGCGEQNMLLFAPNIYILSYLETTEQLTPEIKSKAKTFLESGYQRQLNYRHYDGSYSAFGSSDPSGNTWLTAFVMKSFGGATRYIFIDSNYITRAKFWLSHQQQDDGCMRSVGKLFHNGMKGGVSDEVMLTAYITAAFLELGTNSTDPVVDRSLSCLRLASEQINSTYATALLSYAFTLAGDGHMRETLLHRLDRLAVITEQGRHWERADASGKGSLAVEMTSYVLLALLSGPVLPGFDMTYCSSVVRWLTDQQNSFGGFSSTQDTVVALQALTLYAAATFSKTSASTVKVTSMGGYERQFRVDEHNRLLYQEEKLQELPGNYTIEAEGGSCAFVQLTLQYNIPPPPDFSSFTINASAAGVCNSTKKSLRVFINARYNGGREETNMVIISIRLLSGFLLDKNSVPLMSLARIRPQAGTAGSLLAWQVRKAHGTVKRVEEEEGHVIIYLDELKKNVPEIYFLDIVEDVPVRNLKPAVIKIYDYYDKSDEAVTEYSSPCADNDDYNML